MRRYTFRRYIFRANCHKKKKKKLKKLSGTVPCGLCDYAANTADDLKVRQCFVFGTKTLCNMYVTGRRLLIGCTFLEMNICSPSPYQPDMTKNE